MHEEKYHHYHFKYKFSQLRLTQSSETVGCGHCWTGHSAFFNDAKLYVATHLSIFRAEVTICFQGNE